MPAASPPEPLRPAAAPAAGRERFDWAGRALTALAGEAAQSAFHFAANLALLRALPAYEYGLFAIVFTLGSLALSYAHVATAMPAAVHLPGRTARAAAFLDVAFGSAALAISAAFGLVTALGFLVWGGSVALAAGAGLLVALWSLRNYARNALFARRSPAAAARGDLVFAASGILLLGVSLAFGPRGAGALAPALWALALAHAAGLASAFLRPRRRVRVSFAPPVRRRYRAIGRQVGWSLAAVTAANLQAQFLTLLVAATDGPAAYAPIAAALVLFTPLRLVAAALVALTQPEFAAALRAGEGGAARQALGRTTAALAIVAATYGVLLWTCWTPLREMLIGSKFAGAPMGLLVALAGLATLAYLLCLLPKALLEASGRFRVAALVTAFGAAACMAAVSTLLWCGGAALALLGMALAEAVTLVLFWRAARQASLNLSFTITRSA